MDEILTETEKVTEVAATATAVIVVASAIASVMSGTATVGAAASGASGAAAAAGTTTAATGTAASTTGTSATASTTIGSSNGAAGANGTTTTGNGGTTANGNPNSTTDGTVSGNTADATNAANAETSAVDGTGGAGMVGLMVAQYQFYGMTSYQQGPYPDTYSDFAQSFTWTNFNFQYPHGGRSNSTDTQSSAGTARKLLSGTSGDDWTDFRTYLRWTPEELLFNVSAAILVLCVLVAVVFLGYITFKGLRNTMHTRTHRRRFMKWKIGSLILRLLAMAYFGLAFTTFYMLTRGNDAMYMGLAIFWLVCVLIGLPVATTKAIMTHHKLRQSLEKVSLVAQPLIVQKFHRRLSKLMSAFGPLLSDFKDDRMWFALLALVKVMAVAGVLVAGVSETMESAILMSLYLTYSVSVITLKPYAEKGLLVVDATMSIIDSLTCSVPAIVRWTGTDPNDSTVAWVVFGTHVLVVLCWMFYGLKGIMLCKTHVAKLLKMFGFRSSIWSSTGSRDSNKAGDGERPLVELPGGRQARRRRYYSHRTSGRGSTSTRRSSGLDSIDEGVRNSLPGSGALVEDNDKAKTVSGSMGPPPPRESLLHVTSGEADTEAARKESLQNKNFPEDTTSFLERRSVSLERIKRRISSFKKDKVSKNRVQEETSVETGGDEML